MRVTLTVADPHDARSADVVVEADPATSVGELARSLTVYLRGRSLGTNVTRIGAPRKPVVAPGPSPATATAGSTDTAQDHSGSGASATALRRPHSGDGTVLYLDGRPLDAGVALKDSGLVDGSLVSLGDAALGRTAEPFGAVELRVVAGPGAGTVHRLAAGDASIGSDPACTVVLDDPEAAEVAAIVTVARDGAVALRPAAATAEVLLDREPVPAGGAGWPVGGEVQLGSALLEVHPASAPDAVLAPSADGAWLDYNRPPRLLPPPRRTVFRLPQKPQQPGRGGIPLIGALAPAALGGVMALVLKQPAYLLMALMSPVMLLGNVISTRRQGRKTYRQELKEYREHCAAIEADATRALVTERQARRDANPDPAQVLMIAVGPRSRLWERRRSDPDHLSLRVGTVDLASEVVVEDPEQLEHRRMVSRTARDVPVALDLRECGVVGVAGRDALPRRLASWLIGQLAVLQSPRDVMMYVLTDSDAEAYWRWTTWLPHLHPGLGQDAYALIGQDAETLGRRVAELSQLVAARQSARAQHLSGAPATSDPDVVVVLDGARRLRSLPGVPTILRDGPAVGVYSICLDSDQRRLPEECGAVVAESHRGLHVRQQLADDVDEVRADLVPPAWFQRVARAVAPIRDISDSDDGGALPSSARLLDVLALEPPTGPAVAARWRAGGSSTEAVVGISLDGPFAIDLRRDGPHGLIAGTTGSGKSELLQTLVASLAVANRPDAMTFVLVDYKGGAAFKDCVKLPHTVGMVTDLDTHLVERALTSLSAELTRREHILAAAGAKDLEDYVDYATRDAGLAPLPRLLIVIDEFASMARELPDFVTGLVNIAQRGRSLGIHLLLATQRPTGVVSPEIRANTNLRIALRVTDAAESADVIEVPDAARIAKSTPGRAYVQLGHASLVPFQAGRVGGRRPGAAVPADRRPPPWLETLKWPDLGRPAPQPPRTDGGDESEITDLAVLVDAITQANEALHLPPQHSPWLAALPDLIAGEELASWAATGAPSATSTAVSADPAHIPTVPYGVEDLPAAQEQRVSSIDFARFGHLFIAGAPRSGRSQALRTMAAMVAQHVSCADVHIFGIDCGNGALLPLTRLPHCGAVVQRTQTERATRLITRLTAEVLRRQDVLGAGGFADLNEQRAAAEPADRLPHLLVLLDRWEGFTPTLGEVDNGALTEAIWMIMREGASVGVHVVLTGDRSLLTGRISTLSEDKLLLRLTDRGDFSLAGLNPRTIPETIVHGRAFRADSGIETQFAVLGDDPSGPAQAQRIAEIGAAATARDGGVPRARRPFRVDVLPSRLTFDDAWTMRADDAPRPMWALVGVGGDELLAVGPDLGSGPATFVVAGPPKSGRSTVLVSMARSLLHCGTEVVIAAPKSSPLRALEGTAGVRAVLTDDDLTEEQLAPLVAGPDRVVLMMDDAELYESVSCRDWLRAFIRTAGERTGLVIAGNAADVCQGFSGWQVDVKKSRNGALLSPQNLTDGDIVGVRVARSAIGGQVQPGRALLHLGDGELVTVQVPIAG